jgi:hypothetical protein
MSLTAEGSAPTDQMPAGAMSDTVEPSAGEMPSGGMNGGGGGEMPGGSTAGEMGAATGEMPTGSMLETAGGSAAGEGEMPAGTVTIAIDPATGATDVASGDMPQAARAGATSSPSVEITVRINGS